MYPTLNILHIYQIFVLRYMFAKTKCWKAASKRMWNNGTSFWSLREPSIVRFFLSLMGLAPSALFLTSLAALLTAQIIPQGMNDTRNWLQHHAQCQLVSMQSEPSTVPNFHLLHSVENAAALDRNMQGWHWCGFSNRMEGPFISTAACRDRMEYAELNSRRDTKKVIEGMVQDES